MAFKRRSADVGMPDDPVQLYRLLALNNRGPEAVWGHQQDVLREWHHNMPDEPDVAIELPTGAGKTLVGGLIGEFRRRKDNERIAYLCPTKQLARQTAEKFDEYGIPNVLLVNRVSTWNPAHRAQYEAGEAIAVSVYSHVFNSNPALNNADMLVLDDAHAAEGYVASPWSLTISRDDEESAYLDVLSVLEPALDPLVYPKLRAAGSDRSHGSYIYLASPIGVAAQAAQLEAAISAADGANKLTKEAHHVWPLLQGRLDRCLVYVSYRQILIRPLIPPTMQHSAFSSPARRIYMSATLGDGGELERSFGRKKIKRIPVPEGWEKQGTGRRFFLFPELTSDLSADPAQVPAFVSGIIAKAGRVVVLTPDRRAADDFVQHALPQGCPVLEAGDVENDLAAFTSQTPAALVLTNRYDGIDLPGDDCRLVVLAGLPARGDLQERFLHESLGAVEVLQERIRARIVQGSGRATRNTRDYAAVVVLGQPLTSYLSGQDVQSAMHPEVHAEVEFGRRNSLRTPSAEMLDNLDVFLAHDRDWAEVDDDIVAAREEYTRTVAPSAVELQRSADPEVTAWEAIWNSQWDWALTAVQRVLDRLKGERTPQRYAALWNYLGYSLTHRLAQQTGDHSHLAAGARYYRDARRKSAGTSWLSHLASPSDRASAPAEDAIDPLDEAAMRGIVAAHHGLQPSEVFEEAIAQARSGLAGTAYKSYEAGLVALGTLAGASASYGNNDDEDPAAPDAVWVFEDARWVTWEAKSEAQPTGQVGADNVRQAQGHLRYTETERKQSAPSDSVSLLLSPKPGVMPSARMLAEDHAYLVRPPQVLDLYDRLVRAWRTARARDIPTLSVNELATIFDSHQALPSQWLAELRTEPLKKPEPQ
ncbi:MULTISPECIES: DEAD/DEAH box helicase [unclassified Streptomyces]|uniref:DEAD/DEAH box helicase n=1 Tax=unclassified Streptomyces TaxID=2593676 RepID=UPI0023654046|nr:MULTISPECIES: DEAD/DEAH box helicase [unclassified Streptomyces]WDF45108.1 DEAD/DEAH box helicase [Streptomyces sp. T12]